tara:strand:- start:465 stop:719 length:255 start_codon:yes stop_codon:yes gene_type:complete
MTKRIIKGFIMEGVLEGGSDNLDVYRTPGTSLEEWLECTIQVTLPEKKITITESEFDKILTGGTGIISVGVMRYLKNQLGFNHE